MQIFLKKRNNSFRLLSTKFMKYKIMKEQHKKVFTSLSFQKRSREEVVKLQKSDPFYAEHFT